MFKYFKVLIATWLCEPWLSDCAYIETLSCLGKHPGFPSDNWDNLGVGISRRDLSSLSSGGTMYYLPGSLYIKESCKYLLYQKCCKKQQNNIHLRDLYRSNNFPRSVSILKLTYFIFIYSVAAIIHTLCSLSHLRYCRNNKFVTLQLLIIGFCGRITTVSPMSRSILGHVRRQKKSYIIFF